ncbi:hypothetical protein NMG60_11008813 [Bertholletia excelsa]
MLTCNHHFFKADSLQERLKTELPLDCRLTVSIGEATEPVIKPAQKAGPAASLRRKISSHTQRVRHSCLMSFSPSTLIFASILSFSHYRKHLFLCQLLSRSILLSALTLSEGQPTLHHSKGFDIASHFKGLKLVFLPTFSLLSTQRIVAFAVEYVYTHKHM